MKILNQFITEYKNNSDVRNLANSLTQCIGCTIVVLIYLYFFAKFMLWIKEVNN